MITTNKGAAYDVAMMLKLMIDGDHKDLPQMANYRLAKLYEKVRKIGIEVEQFMIKTAQELGEERKSPDGLQSYGWEVTEAKRPEYNQRVGEYRDQEFMIDMSPIPFGLFGTSQDGLTINQILHLSPFLEQETPVA